MKENLMKKLSSYVPFLLVIALGMSLTAQARESQRKGKTVQGLQKTATLVNGYFDVNRCYDRMQNAGNYVSYQLTNTSGFTWPKGTDNSIVYAAGVWIIGKTGGELRTACCEYSNETAPGAILPSGQPDDPTLPKYKIYKISKADLTNPGDDYLSWPVDQGAPVDENGKPALVGDQMLWFVYNDADPSNHANLFGTKPMGVEVHVTVWGYNRSDAFGDMMFVKEQIINKSSNSYDSTFIGLWSDPDNGYANDDYVGCDTTLSLGYCWNSTNNDAVYGAAGPAIGWDYFQGPIVPSAGDTALVSGRKVPGHKNLPMYAFAYYINGATYPQLDPENAQEVFNYMTGHYQDGSSFVNAETNQPTRFVFPGDPETGTGWSEINPTIQASGDRRLLMSCGPFQLAAGDTQEVVFGVMIARGSNNKNSVTVLKQVDQVAQLAYDLNFALPPAPPTPHVTTAELDQQIALYWDGAAESYDVQDLIDRDPDGNPTSYTFEGYIVYQLNALVGPTESKRLGVFDIKDGITDIKDDVFDNTRGEVVNVTVVKGNDGGAARVYRTTMDAFTALPLVNGHPYYYAVTAYGYNPYGIPKMYEGPLEVFTVTPHAPPPGTRYVAVTGDTITATRAGPSDGTAFGLVSDPSRVNGHDYKVQFRDVSGETVWDVLDVTLGNKVVLADQTNQTGDESYSVIDGVQLKVIGPPPGMKSWDIPSGTRRFSWSGGFAGLGLEGFSSSTADAYDQDNGTIGMAGHFAFGGIGTNLTNTDYHTVLLKLAAIDNVALWDPLATPSDPNISRAYRYLRASTAAPADPSFVPWIINTASGYPYQDYNYAAPFSAWDMDTDPPTRLAVGVFENNTAGGKLDGRYWPGVAGVDDNSVIREFAFIFKSPYTDTPDPSLEVNLSGNSSTPLMWVMVCQRRQEVSWADGDEFQINAYHVNNPAVTFTYTTQGKEATTSTDLAKADINMINVFPNPYLGAQSLERDPINRFVTFSHLPTNAKTTIRIFTLAGALVRTINHTPGSTFERWDLRNSTGIPVASAMYLVHIEMEGLGTKILKLAVIQPEERLDRL
jgi:hypothetical protein